MHLKEEEGVWSRVMVVRDMHCTPGAVAETVTVYSAFLKLNKPQINNTTMPASKQSKEKNERKYSVMQCNN